MVVRSESEKTPSFFSSSLDSELTSSKIAQNIRDWRDKLRRLAIAIFECFGNEEHNVEY